MPPPEKQRALILIAEDNDPFRELMTDVLRKAGHQPTAAPDAATALASLEELRFDLLILDLLLPGMMGTQIIETARKNELHVPPTILLSGVLGSRELHRIAAQYREVRAGLQKPVALPEFMSTVKRVLNSGLEAEIAAARPERKPAPPPSRPRQQRQEEAVDLVFLSPADFLNEYVEQAGPQGGLFVPTSKPLHAGVRFTLRILVAGPKTGYDAGKVTAEVLYSARTPPSPGMGVLFVDVPEPTRQMFDRVTAVALEDPRIRRPLLALVYGMFDSLQLLNERLPEGEIRFREVSSPDDLLRTADVALPDVVLVSVETAHESEDAVRRLKGRAETARVPITVTGPPDAKERMIEAGADLFFGLPDDGPRFLDGITGLLRLARERRHIRVRYRERLTVQSSAHTHEVDALDLSEGELYFVTMQAVAEGDKMAATLHLADGEPPLPVNGTVAWTKPGREAGQTFCCLALADLDATATARVRRYVHQAIRLTNYARFIDQRPDLPS